MRVAAWNRWRGDRAAISKAWMLSSIWPAWRSDIPRRQLLVPAVGRRTASTLRRAAARRRRRDLRPREAPAILRRRAAERRLHRVPCRPARCSDPLPRFPAPREPSDFAPGGVGVARTGWTCRSRRGSSSKCDRSRRRFRLGAALGGAAGWHGPVEPRQRRQVQRVVVEDAGIVGPGRRRRIEPATRPTIERRKRRAGDHVGAHERRLSRSAAPRSRHRDPFLRAGPASGGTARCWRVPTARGRRGPRR